MKWQQPAWVGICALGAVVGLSNFWLPAPLPADAPSASFSALRALEHVQAIAQVPHPAGSAENARAREYLIAQMQKLGLNPREIRGEEDGIKVVNLYGQLEGTLSHNPSILLVAHYDSTPGGPGAADDASGVATILETIRALAARGKLRNSLGILITDGEEARGAMVGSSTFVRDQTDLLKNIRLVVNLEARGNHGPVIMFESGHDNGGRIKFFSHACPLPIAASFSEEVYRRMPNDTDFSNFVKADKRGFNFAFVGGIDHYHARSDTPENLSLRTLQHYGECVLPLAMELGQADETAIEECLKPGDASFFSLWRGLLVCYPAWFARAFAFATAALYAVAVGRGVWRRKLRMRFIGTGLGVALLAALMASAIALGVVLGAVRHFRPFHYGPFIVGVPSDGAIVAGLLLLLAALTFALRVWLLRRAQPSEALAGSLLLWVALTLLTNALLPGASYLFAWTACFGSVALLISCNSEGTTRVRSWLNIILTSLPASLLFAPTFVLFHQAITFGIAPVSALFTALVFCLMPTLGSRNLETKPAAAT